MLKKRRQRPTTDSETDPLSRLAGVIAGKRHWVMYTAEFASVDDAVATLHQFSFFENGRFTGDIEAGVAGASAGGATVLLGGELMADQMGEVQYLFSTRALSFDMRWEKKDEVTEGRVRRSLEYEPPS